MGAAVGLTYVQVNVVLFVILLPLVLIVLTARVLSLEKRLAAQGEVRRLTWPALQVTVGLLIAWVALALL